MSIFQPRLWRTARRLQAAYRTSRGDHDETQLPEHQWQDVAGVLRRRQLAVAHGWLAAADRQQQNFTAELERMLSRLQEILGRERRGDQRPLPSVRLLYEELVAVSGEFGGFAVDEGGLSVVTEPIALEGIDLGPFAIRLETDSLHLEAPYRVRALEPNPAASCCDTTHPHVNGERLCAGEGRAAITAALEEGRLLDFFTVVDRILHTYAVGAAYVELSQWLGVPCHDCNGAVDENDRYTCERCDEPLCGDCLNCCDACSYGYCSACIERCAECEARSCSGCLSTCGRCRREVCEACREGTICNRCLEELEDALAEETDEASEAAEAEPAV